MSEYEDSLAEQMVEDFRSTMQALAGMQDDITEFRTHVDKSLRSMHGRISIVEKGVRSLHQSVTKVLKGSRIDRSKVATRAELEGLTRRVEELEKGRPPAA